MIIRISIFLHYLIAQVVCIKRLDVHSDASLEVEIKQLSFLHLYYLYGLKMWRYDYKATHIGPA